MNRRTFLQNAVCTPGLGAIHPFTLRAHTIQPAFAYVAMPDAIQAFAVKMHSWTLLQTVPSRAPSFLAIHPAREHLYVANEIDEYEGVPQGTVEAYAIDFNTGRLNFLNRRALSLSATRPSHLAVSPDGKAVAVAAGGGGVYNVISIEMNGALGKVTGIRKEVGCGSCAKYQSSAHPHSMAFHPAGRYLIATDLGCDRIISFSHVDGDLLRKAAVSTPAGSGPGVLAFHPSGSVLYVIHELQPLISCHRFHPATGEIEAPFQTIRGQHSTSPSEAALAVGARGDFLYSARASENAVTVWAIDPDSGALSQPDSWRDTSSFPCALHLTSADHSLYSVCKGFGAVLRLSIDSANGQFRNVVRVARVNALRALAIV